MGHVVCKTSFMSVVLSSVSDKKITKAYLSLFHQSQQNLGKSENLIWHHWWKKHSTEIVKWEQTHFRFFIPKLNWV